MLPDWSVGFGRDCAVLPNTATGFSPRVTWIEFSDAILGLFSAAPVSHLLDSWILRLDAGWKDF
jgi:hypothetical protein